jgi:uncharacterized membrane protein YuzA (DUF378 family)
MPSEPVGSDTSVRQFRQILLWPLQLLPLHATSQIQRHWEVLEAGGIDCPWHEVLDEFTGDPAQFQERHYNEFVTFLPYVQRFLYGEGRRRHDDKRGSPRDERGPGSSPMRVFRRDDVSAVRLTARAGEPPLVLQIAHVDLYFFYDIDVVLLNVEVFGVDLTLTQAQEILYRFGRAYPASWDEHGQALHSMHCVEWLATSGKVLAMSDTNERERYLEFVCEHRTPRIGSHWAYLLKPLLPQHVDVKGLIRYRQLEYYRMPLLGFLAVDDPRALTRADFIRLGLVTGAGDEMPYSEAHMGDFEARYCYDRFWCAAGRAPQTRYLSCGHALIVVGDARSDFFLDKEAGVLGQFRHQHFLLFLIAHFQKAALLMFSDRLAEELKRLDITDPNRIRHFKRAIRQNFEIFLRFTHRYWFHEVSEQSQAKALFQLCAGHLALDPLYAEIKERISDMNSYLDTDSLRRQANTVVKLTVVTIFGLIGTVATGFLGMNLIAEAESPPARRLLYLIVVLAAATALTMYAVVKSKRMSDFLDALSDERLPARAKFSALLDVWRGSSRD